MSPPHHSRRSTDPTPPTLAPDENSGELRVVSRRVREVAHHTRGSADAIYSAADIIRKMRDDLSRENKITAGLRGEYQATYGKDGTVPKQVWENKANHAELREEVESLKRRLAWATGALAAVGAIVGIIVKVMH